jgi:peptidoglycan/LPS O-acetylase OafA/YrhL
MLVVVSHAGLENRVPGSSGVTIFLAISGFIITYLVIRERTATGTFSAGRFYLRRALKIGPPLVVIMIAPSLVYAAFGGSVHPGVLASQAFFSYNWVATYDHSTSGALPGSGVLWSLSVEEQFYIVFALFWIIAARRGNYLRYAVAFGCTAIITSFASRVLISATSADASVRINYGTDTRMESIGWGVLTAVLYVTLEQRANWLPRVRAVAGHPCVPAVALAIFLASLTLRDAWFRDTIRYSAQSVSACLIILFGLLGRGPLHLALTRVSNWRPVQLIGLASYSIYLIHQALYFAMNAVAGVDMSAVLAPLYIPIGVLGGIAVYRIVEVPFEHLRAALHQGGGTVRTVGTLDGEEATTQHGMDRATNRQQQPGTGANPGVEDGIGDSIGHPRPQASTRLWT